MHFLDTVVYKGSRFKETGTFDTKIYYKPTDTLELLHKKSHHPNHTFKGLIESQILRYMYVRICNSKQDVTIVCRKLFAALIRRGYSERILRKIKDKTLCELRKKPNKRSSQRCTTSAISYHVAVSGIDEKGKLIRLLLQKIIFTCFILNAFSTPYHRFVFWPAISRADHYYFKMS